MLAQYSTLNFKDVFQLLSVKWVSREISIFSPCPGRFVKANNVWKRQFQLRPVGYAVLNSHPDKEHAIREKIK